MNNNILNKNEQEIVYKEYIEENWKKEIKEHENNKCNCEIIEDCEGNFLGKGLCLTGQWYEGLMSSEDFLREHNLIVGKILDNGLIEKEYYGQGYI